MEEKKEERNDQIEQAMKKQAAETEPKRRQEHQARKDELAVQRREEKMRKRHVNVEIASELIDIIMDVADVAYNKLVDAPAHATAEDREQYTTMVFEEDQLIKKAEWRHWMSIIAGGKKVSEEKLVISSDDPATKAADSMPQLGMSTTQSPYKLICEMKNEPIFDDLLQYLCMCGPVNLRLVAAEKWHQFRDIFQKDQNLASLNLELDFLNGLYIPKNKELGRFIDKLYNGPRDDAASLHAKTQLTDGSVARLDLTGQVTRNSKDILAEEAQASAYRSTSRSPGTAAHAADFPTYHPIKLCMIGRACSGKSTQSKLLLKQLGDKVTLFDMGQVVRDALAYVDPHQAKDEPVDAKAKGKKTQEAPADVHAGKDTTQYKEIASLILK